MFSSLPPQIKSLLRPLKLTFTTLVKIKSNRKVFDSILNLDDRKLDYFSVIRQESIKESEVIAQVNAGDVIIAADIIGKLHLEEKVDDLCTDNFSVQYNELEKIHDDLSIEKIIDGSLNAKTSPLCLQIQSSIMSRILRPHTKKYFLELLPNLRLHLPYSLIKNKEQLIEKRMGRGKLNPHGQHKDSWRYHPKNTINVWVALTEASNKNGLSLLPKSESYNPKYNDEIQEIANGVKTYPSQQYVTNLKKGDALIFKAELLHGSIINTSAQTRVALSMRCAIEQPIFHKIFQYNYIGINGSKFSNLSLAKILGKHKFVTPSQDHEFAPAEKLNTSLKPHSYDEKYIYIENNSNLTRYPRRCSHAGTDLLFGELDKNGNLLCPSHRMCIKGNSCNNKNSNNAS